MKNNKGIAPIIIILIIVGFLAAAGGAYYFFVKKTPKQVACTMEAKVCPDGSSVGRTGPDCEFAACPIAVPNETADWQTYNNTKYNYEIKYPNDYERPDTTITQYASFISKRVIDGFAISVKDNPESLSPQEWWGQENELISNKSLYSYYGIASVSGVQAEIYNRKINDLSEYTFYVIPKDKKIYLILFQILPEEKIQLIVSTFKFIK